MVRAEARWGEGLETYDFLTEALHPDVNVLAHVLSTGRAARWLWWGKVTARAAVSGTAVMDDNTKPATASGVARSTSCAFCRLFLSSLRGGQLVRECGRGIEAQAKGAERAR